MTCYDCKPKVDGNQDPCVELCPRHADLEEGIALESVAARIAIAEHEREERRHYAILQTSALIYASGNRVIEEHPPAFVHERTRVENIHTFPSAVFTARELLAETEKQEKGQS